MKIILLQRNFNNDPWEGTYNDKALIVQDKDAEKITALLSTNKYTVMPPKNECCIQDDAYTDTKRLISDLEKDDIHVQLIEGPSIIEHTAM